MARNIPVLDYRDLTAGGDRRKAYIQQLGEGLGEFGFVAIIHHPVSPSLLARTYEAAAAAFSLSPEEKAVFELPEIGRQRGYTSFGTERAKDASVADLKEFWQVGPELNADHPLAVDGTMHPNVFPDRPAEFGETCRELYADLRAFAVEMVRCIAEHLGQDPDSFAEMVRDGDSVMRVIHYPPVEHAQPGAVRAAAHEDINLLTVLPSSTQPGLELLTPEGEWMPIQVPPDVLICDTGDLMAFLTGGDMPATTHRVVNPPGSANVARYSMPFFLHPRPEVLLTPLKGGKTPRTARDILHERLRAIGML